LVTIYSYNKVGRQTGVIEPQTLVGANNNPLFTSSLVINKQVKYNAFGEIIQRGTSNNTSGVNTVWQEYFDYDQAGRVWRSNQGDGVDKVYYYNLAAQTTLEVKAAISGGVTRDLQTYQIHAGQYVCQLGGGGSVSCRNSLRQARSHGRAAPTSFTSAITGTTVTPTFCRASIGGAML